MNDIPTLAFNVPRGFEKNIASKDILLHLPENTLVVSDADDSGYVLVKPSSLEHLYACLAAYNQGELWSVTNCSLVLSEKALPIELHAILETDRRALPSKRSRAVSSSRSNDVKQKLSKNRKKITPLAVDPLPSEILLLEYLSTVASELREAFFIAFSVWKEFKYGPDCPNRGLELPVPRNFAVRYDRREFLLPSLKSQDIARYLGDELGSVLLAMTRRETIPVDLEDPDMEASHLYRRSRVKHGD